jgi:hypothetical protein
MKIMNINPQGFLSSEEEKLFEHVFLLNEKALAFDESERGNFNEEYFSPSIIPTIPCIPWVQKNAPILLEIKEDVIKILKNKIVNS